MAVPPWNTQVAAVLSDPVRSFQSREAATYHRGLYACGWGLSLFRVRPVPLCAQAMLTVPGSAFLDGRKPLLNPSPWTLPLPSDRGNLRGRNPPIALGSLRGDDPQREA